MAKKRELEQGKISLDKVLQMLVDEYANALDDERIYKPMSYALYQVWREVDKVEEMKNAILYGIGGKKNEKRCNY